MVRLNNCREEGGDWGIDGEGVQYGFISDFGQKLRGIEERGDEGRSGDRPSQWGSQCI